jgi:hypothetical protein
MIVNHDPCPSSRQTKSTRRAASRFRARSQDRDRFLDRTAWSKNGSNRCARVSSMPARVSLTLIITWRSALDELASRRGGRPWTHTALPPEVCSGRRLAQMCTNARARIHTRRCRTSSELEFHVGDESIDTVPNRRREAVHHTGHVAPCDRNAFCGRSTPHHGFCSSIQQLR